MTTNPAKTAEGLVINEFTVPPAEVVEGILTEKLSSLNESLRMLTMSKQLGLTFSDNLAATYHVFRSELSLLENFNKHSAAVYNMRHRYVLKLMNDLQDAMAADDVFLKRVEGEKDPRAVSMVSLLIEAMTGWHLLLHVETKPKERAMVFRLWQSRGLKASKEVHVLTYLLDKRARASNQRTRP